MNTLLPTLRVHPQDIAPRVLVVGDQNRVPEAAKFLDNAEELAWFREYRTFSGEYSGKRIHTLYVAVVKKPAEG